MKKIAFIGFGRMAQALYLGFSRAAKVQADACYVVEPFEANADKARQLGLKPVSIEEANEKCEYLFVCVKPQQLEAVLEQLKFSQDQVIISILAGKTLAHFQKNSAAKLALVRVMPNTPALIGYGATGLYFNEEVKTEDKAFISDLFESVGEIICVDQEALIDDVTAISGSGPAFCYQLAQDWVSADIALNPKDAMKLVAQTLIGAGKMLQHHPEPNALITAVKSPGGTTEAGLDQYEKENISKSFQKVVETTVQKAKLLSQ